VKFVVVQEVIPELTRVTLRARARLDRASTLCLRPAYEAYLLDDSFTTGACCNMRDGGLSTLEGLDSHRGRTTHRAASPELGTSAVVFKIPVNFGGSSTDAPIWPTIYSPCEPWAGLPGYYHAAPVPVRP